MPCNLHSISQNTMTVPECKYYICDIYLWYSNCQYEYERGLNYKKRKKKKKNKGQIESKNTKVMMKDYRTLKVSAPVVPKLVAG